MQYMSVELLCIVSRKKTVTLTQHGYTLDVQYSKDTFYAQCLYSM
jgi:hypothetical protein